MILDSPNFCHEDGAVPSVQCQLCVQSLEQIVASGNSTLHDTTDGFAPAYLLDLLKAHQQSEWPPPLPQGCDYHLFISKHAATAKELSENIARELTELGLTIWLSQSEAERGEPIDAAGMKLGVEKSAMVLLILPVTPGIFRRERKWMTHTEVKFAIDLGKPIQLLAHGFNFHSKNDDIQPRSCSHLQECGQRVAADIQLCTRAMIKALPIGGWASVLVGGLLCKQLCIRQILEKFHQQADSRKRLEEHLEEQ